MSTRLSAGPVLHLIDSARASGLETMLAAGARAFDEAGFPAVVVGQGEWHPYASQLEDRGIRFERVGRLPSPRAAWQLWSLIRHLDPAAVHLHSEHVYLSSAVVARLATRAPVVRTIHSIYDRRGARRLVSRVRNWWSDRVVDAVVACGPGVVEAPENEGRPLRLLWNWVRPEFVEGEPWRARSRPCPPEVVLVGNCAPVKGHEDVLAAALESDARVVHVGDPALASPHERQLLEELRDRGSLTEWAHDDVPGALRTGDVLAMPSRREGLGVAVMEALCVGVPVAISTTPGLSWATSFGAQVVDSWRDELDRPADERRRPDLDLARRTFGPDQGTARYTALYSELAAARRTGRRRRVPA